MRQTHSRQTILGLGAGLAVLLAAHLAVAATPAAAPLIQVTARPTKLLYGVREPITATVTVKNVSPAAQNVTVSAALEGEIDEPVGKVQEKAISVGTGMTVVAEFKWPASPKRYGHAFKAEVKVDGGPVIKAEDYFNVCDHYWNVALIAAEGFLWQQFDGFKPRSDMKWADDTIAGWRREYYNGFEKFFWAPDDFLELTPDKEIWWSGQARYLETKTGLRTLIARGHDEGLKAVTYAKLTGGGPTGAEMARRHPEWIWQSGGVLAVDRNAKQLAEWDITTSNHWGGWVAVNYNMNDPKVVDIGIKELGDSASLFGWDGARWDGNFDVAREVYNLDGKRVETLTAEQADERDAQNMRRTKEAITRRHPLFVYGYNWTQGNWAQSMATNPKESTELCRGGGLIMNEYINQAEGVQHPLHRWEVYGRSVADDVEAIKKLGGYYGPILGSPDSADGRYQNVFAYAAGAHPYYHHHWGAFMTRYGTFCWDDALVRRHDAEKLATVTGNAWWQHWVFERPLDAKHRQLILHLINPPAKPTVGEGKKKDDLPAPLHNVGVVLLPAALDGWTFKRATRLSPEPMLREEVAFKAEGDGIHLTIPEVAIWNVLVIDLGK